MIRALLLASLLVPGVVDLTPTYFTVTVPEAGIYRMHPALLVEGVGHDAW